MIKRLLSVDKSNAKLAKTHDKFGRDWDTYILYLAPATVATKQGETFNACPASTPECRAGCLFYAGQAQVFKNINVARVNKTRAFIESREAFLDLLKKELRLALKRANKSGKRVAVRLNGTSDIDWVSLGIIGNPEFDAIQFYDYTKLPTRAIKWARGELPRNYQITFSRSETNARVAERVLAAGANVAAVYSHRLTLDFDKIGQLDGDLHDARFLDVGHGKLILLKAKGKARNTESQTGFVLNLDGLMDLLNQSTQEIAA